MRARRGARRAQAAEPTLPASPTPQTAARAAERTGLFNLSTSLQHGVATSQRSLTDCVRVALHCLTDHQLKQLVDNDRGATYHDAAPEFVEYLEWRARAIARRCFCSQWALKRNASKRSVLRANASSPRTAGERSRERAVGDARRWGFAHAAKSKVVPRNAPARWR